MSNIPPPPSFDPTGGHSSSGPVTPVENGTRLAAAILEVLLVLVTCGIGWLIWSVILWKNGETPAKKIMNLRVVDAATGAPASMQQMVMRELVGKMSIGVIGDFLLRSVLGDASVNVGALVYLVSGIMILVNSSRQGIWDYIAKTTVARAG